LELYTCDAEQVGERIVIARHILGKDRSDIARVLGIPPTAYAKLERGDGRVFSQLERLSEVLMVPRDFLVQGALPLIPTHALSYRRKVALKSPAARRIQGISSLAPELTQQIEQFVALPPVTVPHIPVDHNQDIESISRMIRLQFQLSDGPIKDTVALAEALGVVLFWTNADEEFDGVSLWADGRPYIILNSRKNDGYRSRFTLMHELGHLILHRNDLGVEQQEDERRRRDREADAFASSFLMPPSSFGRWYPKYGTVFDLLAERTYWRVSCSAMVRRARDLSLISEEQYKRFSVSISAKGWRRGEPNPMQPEQSRVHRFFLDELGEHGITTAKLSLMAGIPESWLYELLPQSKFYREMTRVIGDNEFA